MTIGEILSAARDIAEKNSDVDAKAGFNPDKRIDARRESNEVRGKVFNLDKRLHVVDDVKGFAESVFKPDSRFDRHYTTYEERLSQCASEKNRTVRFEGTRGESKLVPRLDSDKGRALAEKLKEYGQSGIDFKNALPDFSKVANERVEIGMTSDLETNYKRADTELAKKWNAEARDDRTDWSPREVKAWRKENGLTIHEDADMKTCFYVPFEIHDSVLHSGGRAEIKKKDGISSGGKFDA